MPIHPYISTKKVFMDTIGFLNWAELDTESLRELGVLGVGVTRVFLSPDVHSLDIIWENADGSFQGEIADYPRNDEGVSLTEFLNNEVGEDSWQMWDVGDITDVYEELLSDVGTWTAERTKVISLKTLQDAEAKELESQQARTSRLFALLDFPPRED